MDDRDLLRRLTDGEAQAWETLVRAHAPLLHAAVAKIVGPDAEDVVQAVFLKLWADGRRRLRAFEGRSRLSTWLVAIARREAVDRLRSRAGAAAPAPDLRADDFDRLRPEIWNGHSPPADAEAEIREANAALAVAMDGLPPRDRLLVRLVYLDGHPYVDVARLLSVPENSISPWLVRARQRLKARLALPARATRTDSDAAPL